MDLSKLKAMVNLLNYMVVNPLLALLFGAALIVFLYGMAQFFFKFNVQGDLHAKDDGARHMLWGLVGMFIMLCAWSIMQIIGGTVGNSLPSTAPQGGGGGGGQPVLMQ